MPVETPQQSMQRRPRTEEAQSIERKKQVDCERNQKKEKLEGAAINYERIPARDQEPGERAEPKQTYGPCPRELHRRLLEHVGYVGGERFDPLERCSFVETLKGLGKVAFLQHAQSPEVARRQSQEGNGQKYQGP